MYCCDLLLSVLTIAKVNAIMVSLQFVHSYCILTGFEEGNIKTDKSDGLDLDFCCRHDGSTLDHMVLPSREPLVLMKKDRKSCQAIKGMIKYSAKTSLNPVAPYFRIHCTNNSICSINALNSITS